MCHQDLTISTCIVHKHPTRHSRLLLQVQKVYIYVLYQPKLASHSESAFVIIPREVLVSEIRARDDL
jgi:hypothetical protein